MTTRIIKVHVESRLLHTIKGPLTKTSDGVILIIMFPTPSFYQIYKRLPLEEISSPQKRVGSNCNKSTAKINALQKSTKYINIHVGSENYAWGNRWVQNILFRETVASHNQRR